MDRVNRWGRERERERVASLESILAEYLEFGCMRKFCLAVVFVDGNVDRGTVRLRSSSKILLL